MRIASAPAWFLVAGVGSAQATLVYEKPTTHAIVVAHDDGSSPHTITHGVAPVVAPDGEHVIFLAASRKSAEDDIRLVGIGGGKSRVLLRHAGYDTAHLSQTWSPNSRFIVGASEDFPVPSIIDVVHGTQHVISDSDVLYGGASFAPDSNRVVLDDPGYRNEPGELQVRDIRGRHPHHVATGDVPVWGRGGLAFKGSKGVMLKPQLKGPAKLLLGKPGTYPVAWSKGGDRLLAAALPDAVLVTPSSQRKVVLARNFSEIDAISRDGKLVLGVMRGNVVSVRENGATRVLAAGANSASWTK